jgi:hypothetical protein
VCTLSCCAAFKSPDREMMRASRDLQQATPVSCTATASSTRSKALLSPTCQPRLLPEVIQKVECIQDSAGGGVDAAGRRTRRRRDSAHAAAKVVDDDLMEFVERVDPEAEARRVRSEAATA